MLLFPADVQHELVYVCLVRDVRLLLVGELQKSRDLSLEVFDIQQNVVFDIGAVLLEHDPWVLVLVLEHPLDVGYLLNKLSRLLVPSLVLDPELDLLQFDLAIQVRSWGENEFDDEEVLAGHSEGLRVD